MANSLLALRDLFRPRYWDHLGITGWTYDQWPDQAPPRSWRPWLSRFTWRANLHPWIGGDEWCRWTLVVPLGFAGLVIPLWSCRDPKCEACDDCIAKVRAPLRPAENADAPEVIHPASPCENEQDSA